MLRGIEKTCPVCNKTFYYCQNCWRGQKYCCRVCSVEGRRRNRRKAQKKYAATEKGRTNQRIRQKNFRIRQILKEKVTDHPTNQNRFTLYGFRRVTNKTSVTCRCCCCQRPIQNFVGGSENDPLEDPKEYNYFSFARA